MSGNDFGEKVTIEVVKQTAGEAYNDLVKPTAQELGDTIKRSVKVILAPVRALCWSAEKIEEVITNGVNKRLENISQEKLKTPDPEIAVPLVQSLVYTAQNDVLREMYLNLLTNSMNKDMDEFTHPAFVDIIRRMNILDAKVFNLMVKLFEPREIIQADIEIVGKNQIIAYGLPDWHIGFNIEGYNTFDVSASLIRLEKYGLLMLDTNRTTSENRIYEILENEGELQDILNEYKQKEVNKNVELRIDVKQIGICIITDYGRQFKKACL